MRAIILAAGEGKRLRPLTNNIPKCMVKLFGKSILEHQIMTLRSCGINDISVVTGYCKDHVDFPGIKYYHNENFDSTNMVETLFCAKEKFCDSVIVSYGDIIFQSTVLKKLINSVYDTSIVIDNHWKVIMSNLVNNYRNCTFFSTFGVCTIFFSSSIVKTNHRVFHSISCFYRNCNWVWIRN